MPCQERSSEIVCHTNGVPRNKAAWGGSHGSRNHLSGNATYRQCINDDIHGKLHAKRCATVSFLFRHEGTSSALRATRLVCYLFGQSVLRCRFARITISSALFSPHSIVARRHALWPTNPSQVSQIAVARFRHFFIGGVQKSAGAMQSTFRRDTHPPRISQTNVGDSL